MQIRERIGGNFFGMHGKIENKVGEDDQPDGYNGGASFAPEEQRENRCQNDDGEQGVGPIVEEVCGVGRLEADSGEEYPDQVGQKCAGEKGPEGRAAGVRAGG